MQCYFLDVNESSTHRSQICIMFTLFPALFFYSEFSHKFFPAAVQPLPLFFPALGVSSFELASERAWLKSFNFQIQFNFCPLQFSSVLSNAPINRTHVRFSGP